MNVCIGKKVSHEGLEFLDFACDNDGKLLVFPSYDEALSELKKAVGDGEILLQFVLTTVEEHLGSARMQEVIVNDPRFAHFFTNQASQSPQPPAQSQPPTTSAFQGNKQLEQPKVVFGPQIEFMFIMDAKDVAVVNNDSIFDKSTNRHLVPVIAFVDPQNPQTIVQMESLNLKTVFVDVFQQE